MDKLEWSALEYEERERSTAWFWALGIVVVTSSIAAIIFGNYFFAVLLILSGVLLAFFATKKPDTVSYELNEKGLKIRTRLYPYANIKSFWVQNALGADGNPLKPILFIKTERIFMPIISIPIEEIVTEDLRSVFLDAGVPEEEMREHASQKIMEYLGF